MEQASRRRLLRAFRHRGSRAVGEHRNGRQLPPGGAKLLLLDGPGAKITPEIVDAACDRIWKDVHQVQPAAISVTNATEYGRAYRAAEVAALGDLAKRRGLALHMDGARLANALA